MSRLLYESSVSYKGYLIIPFVFATVDCQTIFSYKLLSDQGYKSKLHKLENMSGICSSSVEGIIDIAKEYLDSNIDVLDSGDNFKLRYTYRYNLIIIYEVLGKYFYDHYSPDNLNNIAAPRIFASEAECIKWIKQGLDLHHNQVVKKKSG